MRSRKEYPTYRLVETGSLEYLIDPHLKENVR